MQMIDRCWLHRIAFPFAGAMLLCASSARTSAQALGQWEGPYDLGTDCAGCGFDDIGHATLIPTGTNAGRVLFWTECQFPPLPCNYTSWILDSSLMSATGLSFSAAYPSTAGPFCSGHNWILDENENAKFLVVGGVDSATAGDASRETFWFDPSSSAWQDGPGTLPILEQNAFGNQEGTWYPTVMTFFDPVALPVPGDGLRGDERSPGGRCPSAACGAARPIRTVTSGSTIPEVTSCTRPPAKARS